MPQKNTIKEYAPDSYYHIYARGVNKQNIFNEAADYSYFLSLFDRYLSGKQKVSKTGVIYPDYAKDIELLAYCLMTNHLHLLIYQKDQPEAIKDFMRCLLTSYSKYFNAKYRRVGSLFESRYKAKRIDDDNYLIHISRYVHMNPRRWRAYSHSSLSYYAAGSPPGWLKPGRVLGSFKNSHEYLNFLNEYEQKKTELDELKYQLADK